MDISLFIYVIFIFFKTCKDSSLIQNYEIRNQKSDYFLLTLQTESVVEQNKGITNK